MPDQLKNEDTPNSSTGLKGIDSPISFAGVILPSAVPYLGPLEDYFIGSGAVGAGGDTKGVWNYLIGPGYTFYGYIKSPESFIRREEIRLILDGQETALSFEMRRLRGTGMFFGAAAAGTVQVNLVEFANQGKAWVTRLINVENQSDDTGHTVEIQAALLTDDSTRSAVSDRAVTIAHGCDDKRSDKHAAIGFIGERATAGRQETEGAYILKSGRQQLSCHGEPGSIFTTALIHGMYRDDSTAGQVLTGITDKRASEIMADAGRCIMQWSEWLSGGDPLSGLGNERVRDLLEGALIIIKMLQGTDGGIMATARSYMDSYIRDSAGALRGLTSFGFVREAECFMQWAQHKFDLTHAIVCNANIGDDDNWFPGYGTPENWAAESPALYLLTARDYFRCMQRKGREQQALDFLSDITSSLDFAADVQIDALLKHDWQLRFNGDETESGGSGIPLMDRPDLQHHWSMPSLALCASSLEFYIAFLSMRGLDPRACKCSLSGDAVDLGQVLEAVMSSIDDHFWRTDLQEHPAGFYDWYRTEDGGWPRLRITNFSLFPLFYETPLHHPERAVLSAMAMKRHFNLKGHLPIQPGGLNAGFCGHDLGYLLFFLARSGDPMAESVFQALTCGGTMGCWGTWSEAYDDDGVPHTLSGGEEACRIANMRPFETGINLAAIRMYFKNSSKHAL